MKRRQINIFSLSFLDIITCGLGAIILLFVLVNAKSAAQRDSITSDFRAEVDRMEQEVLEGKKDLIQARNSMEQTKADLVRTEGLARRIIEILEQKKIELSDRQDDTLATTTHVNKLKSDLKSIEEELKRLRAGAKCQDPGRHGHPAAKISRTWRPSVFNRLKDGRQTNFYFSRRLSQYAR
jgi:hypothetical protein